MVDGLNKDEMGSVGVQGAAVLYSLPEISYHGEVVAKIAKGRVYTRADVKVSLLADALNSRPEILALGVVDNRGDVVGIVERRELTALLSRQYGRDIYRNRMW